MKIIFLLITFLTFNSLAADGTLILAHGSMRGCGYDKPTTWEKNILKSVNQIENKTTKTIQVAFGMWNTKCFQKGIDKLKEKLQLKGEELTTLNVLPLFLSSHSAVIEMQKYIFLKKPNRPFPMPMATKIEFEGKINYLNAIDYHPIVSMVFLNRGHHLIHLAGEHGIRRAQMDYVVVMHGPVSDHDNIKWMEMGKQYIQDLQYLFPLKNVTLISLRDDAPEQVREKATKQLQLAVKESIKNGRTALVLPLILSAGGIDAGIKERLEGLDYVWSGEGLLPDQHFSHYLLQRLKD